jgi:4-hydroxy-3-polyprenylbenzoate decarboxylase
MPYKNLKHFIEALEKAGELIRIKEYVNPRLEITEITDRISKNNGPALLFENNGTAFPLLINAMGSEKRMCLALGVNSLDDIAKDIENLFAQFTSPREGLFDKLKLLPKLKEISEFMPKVKKGRGECQQVKMGNGELRIENGVKIIGSPDITKLPVLTCWIHDGGPFITFPVVHTKDPETGIRNQGMYRMQVFDKDGTAMHWHLHKGAGYHFDKHHSNGTKMPVTVTLGGDPVYTYVATAPLPDNLEEYILAGFLRKKAVSLVKCLTNELEVPADSDFVIEGYIDPEEDEFMEGPFGDHTGYYSLADYYPKFHITCITHRKDAVYPATIVGIPPQEDAYIGKATERIFLAPMKMSVAPEIVDIHMPVEGVFHNIVILKIKKKYQGQAVKVMNSLWGAGQMMFNKIMIVVDSNVNIFDYDEMARVIADNVNPLNDIIFSKGPLDVLDHSAASFAFGSKMGIDATVKNIEELADFHFFDNNYFIDKESVLLQYLEVKAINDDPIKDNLPVVIIAVEKNRRYHIKQLNEHLLKNGLIKNIRYILYVESLIDITDISNVVWRFANNIDPKRDSYFVQMPDGSDYVGIAIDGTRKTKEYDDFQRAWPNIIVMDDETIKGVDEKWDKLGLGKFLPSPSLKYKSQVYKGKAISE